MADLREYTHIQSSTSAGVGNSRKNDQATQVVDILVFGKGIISKGGWQEPWLTCTRFDSEMLCSGRVSRAIVVFRGRRAHNLQDTDTQIGPTVVDSRRVCNDGIAATKCLG